MLVTGSIRITRRNQNTKVAFKNCAPFKESRTEINETFIEEVEHSNITMPMYNLIEYSDNYSNTSGSLWQLKRDEIVENNDLTVDNSSSFKYKSDIIGNLRQAGTKTKIIVPLKHLSNFWRSLEIPLINCKVGLSLNWYENFILFSAGKDATFTITDAKLDVPIVILSSEDNAKLSKVSGEGFKRPVYWNKYKVIPNKIVEISANNEEKPIRELLDSSCQGVERLLVLAYNNTKGNNQVSVDSYRKYSLPRVNYNIETDGRNFYDQSIND